jgi:hypothetical protein
MTEKTLITIWFTDRDSVRLEFKPADLWVGVFWKKSNAVVPSTYGGAWMKRLDVWLCLLPCLPLHLQLHWGKETQV